MHRLARPVRFGEARTATTKRATAHDFQTIATVLSDQVNKENTVFHRKIVTLFSVRVNIFYAFRRKMSLFSGHPDKHRGVVIESPEMEEEDPVEFGPKLTSKFFAFFFSYVSRTSRPSVHR